MAVFAPRLTEVRCEGATLRVEGSVPKHLDCFDGHFPGHPVLPGFVQLDWVVELAREHLGVPAVFSRIEALKFREPLLPEDPFSLRIEARDGIRFGFSRSGREISEGRLRDAAPPPAHHPVAPKSSPGGAWPLHIPQQGDMRLLQGVLSHRPSATVCQAHIGATTPLLREGRAPAWLALELLAQAMAAQGGIERGEGAPLRRAFVVGARRIELCTRGFQADETLWVRADHQRGETGFVLCDCTLGSGDAPDSAQEAAARALARGRLTAFVEAGESATP